MSEHLYEAKNIALYHEYKDLNGHLSHDAFMERHPRVNAYVVNLMRDHGRLPPHVDRSESAKRFDEMDLVQVGD